jgi:hypothetical protein
VPSVSGHPRSFPDSPRELLASARNRFVESAFCRGYGVGYFNNSGTRIQKAGLDVHQCERLGRCHVLHACARGQNVARTRQDVLPAIRTKWPAAPRGQLTAISHDETEVNELRKASLAEWPGMSALRGNQSHLLSSGQYNPCWPSQVRTLPQTIHRSRWFHFRRLPLPIGKWLRNPDIGLQQTGTRRSLS